MSLRQGGRTGSCPRCPGFLALTPNVTGSIAPFAGGLSLCAWFRRATATRAGCLAAPRPWPGAAPASSLSSASLSSSGKCRGRGAAFQSPGGRASLCHHHCRLAAQCNGTACSIQRPERCWRDYSGGGLSTLTPAVWLPGSTWWAMARAVGWTRWPHGLILQQGSYWALMFSVGVGPDPAGPNS